MIAVYETPRHATEGAVISLLAPRLATSDVGAAGEPLTGSPHGATVGS